MKPVIFGYEILANFMKFFYIGIQVTCNHDVQCGLGSFCNFKDYIQGDCVSCAESSNCQAIPGLDNLLAMMDNALGNSDYDLIGDLDATYISVEAHCHELCPGNIYFSIENFVV